MEADKKETRWIKKEIEKIKYTYGLNSVIRYNFKRKEKFESQSVAEHVYNMLILAHYFRDLEDPKHEMDFGKVVKMILMHDMGEIETGDIVMGLKTATHSNEEEKAIKKVARKSPNFIQKDIVHLYAEFENPKTIEGKFAKAIDKIEAQFWFGEVTKDFKMVKKATTLQQRISNENKRIKIFKELEFPYISAFAKILREDHAKRGLFNFKDWQLN